MTFHNPAYSIPLFISALISLGLAWLAWQRRTAPGATPLALMLLTTTLWAGANSVIIEASQASVRVFAFNILILGSMWGTPAFMAFALEYTGRAPWLTRRNIILLCLMPAVSVFLAWTNSVHHLVYAVLDFATPLPNGSWLVQTGPWYNLFLAYGYSVVLLATGLIVMAYVRAPSLYRGQAGTILIGTLVPLAGNMIYNLIVGAGAGHIDPTPFLFTIMGIIYAFGLFSFRLFAIIPIARNALVEGMQEGIMVIDTAARIVDANPAMEKILGLRKAALIGKTQAQVFSAWPHLLAPQSSGSMDREWEIASGGRVQHFEMTVTPISNNHQMIGHLLVARDITERKEAEGELRRYRDNLEIMVAERTAELEASNRELESLSYNIAHDMRSPVRALVGLSYALQESHTSKLDEIGQADLALIHLSAQRLGHLIDDFLAYLRLGRASVRKQTIGDMNALITPIKNQLLAQNPGREINFNVSQLPACEADPALLEQVWSHLLANAIKFTRPRAIGLIEIGSLPHPALLSSGVKRIGGAGPVYFVRDNGIGFDMKYAEKIFSIFQHLNRQEEYEGTGVGLAIVQRIIQRHGGYIWAEAEVDQGATFYFTV